MSSDARLALSLALTRCATAACFARAQLHQDAATLQGQVESFQAQQAQLTAQLASLQADK